MLRIAEGAHQLSLAARRFHIQLCQTLGTCLFNYFRFFHSKHAIAFAIRTLCYAFGITPGTCLLLL